jgi:hypothetical protein
MAAQGVGQPVQPSLTASCRSEAVAASSALLRHLVHHRDLRTLLQGVHRGRGPGPMHPRRKV